MLPSKERRFTSTPAALDSPSPLPLKTAAIRTVAQSAPDSQAGPKGIDETSEKTLNERVSSLYHHSDPFGSAARIRALISTLPAEDFQWLAAKAKNLPTHDMDGVNQEFSQAVMDALVERWLQVDSGGALSGIRQLEERFKKPFDQGSPLNALARIRPEIILDNLQEGASWGAFDQSIPNAFSRMAERDPIAARRYLERCRLPDQRKQAEEGIAFGVAKKNPMSAVKLAVELQSPAVFNAALVSADRVGAGMVAQVLDVAAGKVTLDRFVSAELIMRYPDLPWDDHAPANSQSNGISSVYFEAATTLTPEERERVLANADRLPPRYGEQAVAAIVNTWASEEPQKAVEWALNHSVPEDRTHFRNSAVSWAFSSFLKSNEAAAVEWWSRLPSSPLRQALGNWAAADFVNEGKVDLALSLFQPSSDEQSASVAAALVAAQPTRDPVETAAWLDTLPQDVKRGGAVTTLMVQWIGKDAGKAAEWVEAQPAGLRRDQAVSAFASAAAERDPNIAEEWAATITDPKLRQSAVHTIYDVLNRQNSMAAKQWLRSLPGTDDAWRERLMRSRY